MGVILHQRQLSTEQAAVVSLRPHLLKLGLINPLLMHVKLPKHVLIAWRPTWLRLILIVYSGDLSGLFLHFKNAFTLDSSLFRGVINLDGVQLFEFLPFDEAALVAEPLVCEVLAAAIAYFLVGVTILLLRPIAYDFDFPQIVALLTFQTISSRSAGIHYLLPTRRV